ncbi:MAG: ABC transporter ATP-binding protein [Pseudomonadota bacterium]
MGTILACHEINMRFGGLVALADVDFSVEEGDIIGVIGPNGAGKTTLFNVIAGALTPTSGDILFRGKRISGLGSNRICRMGIARTYQLVRPFASLTALENVLIGVNFGREPLLPARERVEAALKELDFVGLGAKADENAENLTLVEKKRLEIARALATDPRILLLDEVVSGLTPSEVITVIETIREISRRGITVVMIEHVLKVVMELCAAIMVLHYGTSIAYGSPKEVVQDQQVISAYLGTPQVHGGGEGA